MPDPRTGYYVAGRDWPAIPAGIPLGEVYPALASITDEAVEAARVSLAVTAAGQEGSDEDD